MKRSLILLIISIVLVSTIFAINTANKTQIIEGKNNITTGNEFRPIYVSDFINQYNGIEVISYKKDNETIGYVNTFGGIGEDFIMYPNSTYEVFSKINLTLDLR